MSGGSAIWRNEADRIYASVLSHADDRIGEVLDTLDRLDIADETLVIFSSDNGPARAAEPTELALQYDTATGAGWGIAAAKGITGGRRGYKASLFEGGIGVPFIARWPGKIAAGKSRSSSVISAVDLLPTFCEIAGVELPADYQPDGISQLETLGGRSLRPAKNPYSGSPARRGRRQRTGQSIGSPTPWFSTVEAIDQPGPHRCGTLRSGC